MKTNLDKDPSTRLRAGLRHSADFVTEAEIKICLHCGGPYSVARAICPDCRRREHTKTLLIVATWKNIPKHLQDKHHSGPGVRVTNVGNAI